MKTELYSKDIVSNFSYTTYAMILNRVGNLIFSIILARFLMPEGFGIYNLALSVSLVIVIFSDLGIDVTLTRYLTKSLKAGNIPRHFWQVQNQGHCYPYRYSGPIRFYRLKD